MLHALVALFLHTTSSVVIDHQSCRLSADNHTLTIVVTNPVPHDVEWTAGCKYRLPDGSSAGVSCKAMVPAGAREFDLCTRIGWDNAGDSETH